MITIWHCPPTRSVRIVWLCEEMGLPYDVKRVGFAERSKELLAVSPLGQLPAIQIDDQSMIESIAIMQYLTQRFGPTPLALTLDDPDYPAFLQFLHHGEAGLAALGNALVATKMAAPDDQKNNWTADYIQKAMAKRLRLSSRRLQDREWLAGDRFTIADISVGYALSFYQKLGVVDALEGPLASYATRVWARPAYLAAIA